MTKFLTHITHNLPQTLCGCLAALAMSMIAGGCDHSQDPAPPAPPAMAPRTVLIYMGADNNLGSSGFDQADLSEMYEGARSGALRSGARVLIYHSSTTGAPALVELTEGAVTDTLVRYDRSLPATSAQRMADVIADSRSHAPAVAYGLVVWGHGTGWLQDGISEGPVSHSIGPDGGKRMNITTLAQVLENAACFDYIYFDCCYMASVETLYQLRNSASYIVGSATELPASGMDYSLNLALLADGSAEALVESARNTFGHYDSLSGSARTCTMSVVRTDALDELAAATAQLYSQALAPMPQGYVPQRFSPYGTTCRYFDFRDYVHALGAACGASLERFDRAFSNALLYTDHTPFIWASVSLDRHNGLSTFILEDASSAMDRNYNTLAWYADVARTLTLKTLPAVQ